ncbi:MAG: hypothetical protein Q4C15_11825 [Eubacteriales bacterium]|nr:hypothetical protein [Eubacteriales bacterium]
MKFSSEFTRYKIISTVLILSIGASVCACNSTTIEESSETVTSSSETTITATPTPTPTTTEETIVYIYGGRYYMAGDSQIEGKSGLTSMTLSEAQSAGYSSGAEMTDDEQCAYDYNLAWNMIAEGKSDEEIAEALMSEGYCKNEVSANMMVEWVREDWDMGIRAYEEPQNTPSVPSSNGGNSGSGNSGSGNSGSSTEPTGSTYVPSNVTPIPTEQTTQPTTAPTSAPTQPTSAPEPTSAPTQPTSAPTEPTSAPEPTTAPTETTPAPTEAKYIDHYEFTGTAYDDADNSYSFSCTGSSLDNCADQFYTYCANHGYYPGNYGCVAVWSDGSRTYA